MSMHIQYAAHVDHGIAHSSNIAQISLGLGAAVVATLVVVSTGGTALLAFGAAAAAAGTVATAGSLGIAAGSIIDKFVVPKSNECLIKTGHDTVRLGPQAKKAARADHDDCKTDGWHVDKLAEGSEIVMLGPEIKPMSRRADRADAKCGGTVAEGLQSLLVGGKPSRQGKSIEEQGSTALWAISLVFDLVGAGSGAAKGGALNIARGVASAGAAVIGGDTANVVGVATMTKPGNALEVLSSANTLFKGGQTAVSAASSVVGAP